MEYRVLHSPSGRRRLELELREKGVSDDIIDADFIRNASLRTGAAALHEAAQKRSRRYMEQPQEVRERRLAAFLARRGFSYEHIRTALAQVDSYSDTDYNTRGCK